ncbi:L-aspartate oxidase [Marinicauda salina]|uniref:L-aspartate oxidase n=1 Tax=Marinicauda salina TaxID=2135793 RepID=A0A2U2BUA4_9PROT|nr:L-aspartate oxidase [Marinicauda salina]PWE17616.1 L-aspartate oxidase [Marinicauda salina]
MKRPLLIVGAGVAGLWTALHAAPTPTVLLTGGKLGTGASTGWAQGGVAAALGPDDSPELHARDTIAAGAGLVDEAAAHLLAEAGPREVAALAALGVPFEHEADGRWALSREAAHSRARVARVKGDQAGASIFAALIRAVRAADHVEIREGWRAEALMPDENGGCAGVLARAPNGGVQPLAAEQTVLAMGSSCGLYAVATTPQSSQGRSLAMAARLGATIRDPEFVQFHPTAIDIGRDPAPLATEALRGEGATMLDAEGRRFMAGVHPDAELAPRDVVARAVHRQLKAGRGAFLDARSAVGAAFPDRFPAVFAACMSAGVDPRTQPIPIATAAHYNMGGIATDLDTRTDVEGLFAVGECACTGVDGANRLASNSLLECLVFGRRAAQAIAGAGPRRIKAGAAMAAPDLPPEMLGELRRLMSAHAGVERDAKGLSALIAAIDAMEDRCGPADGLVAARFVAAAALARQESRGGHFRTDHPETLPQAAHTELTLEQARGIAADQSSESEHAE